MTGDLQGRARRYLTDAVRAFERAPVEVTLCLFLAVTFSYAVKLGDDALQTFAEMAAAMLLAVTCAWSATLLHALGVWPGRTRWIITLAGAALAALYGIFYADFTRAAEAWRALTLGAAALFWLIALPAFAGARGDATDRMRRIDARIVLRTIGVLLYAGALYAGLALAIGAVNELFELDLTGRTYAYVFGWIFLALVPWVIIGGLDDYVRPVTEDTQVARVAHRMAALLVPLLLVIYYLILYAYAIRISVTGEVPKNLLSPLVIAAGALAGLTLLLFDPRPEERTALRPLRLAAPLFVPPALLGIWALTQRLDQYGWTEFRALRVVVLAVFALLAVAATVQLVRRCRYALQLLPATLAAVLVLAAIGPWSVLAVARRSQQDRLSDALEQAGFARDGTRLRADTTVANTTYEQIRTAGSYLLEHFGAEALPPVLAAYARNDRFIDLAARLGLRTLHPIDVMGPGGLFARLPDGADISTAEQPRTYYVSVYAPMRGRQPPTVRIPQSVHAVVDGIRVLMQVGTESVSADLTELSQSLARARSEYLLPAKARVAVTDASGQRRGDILVLELQLSGDSTLHVQRLLGLLTLRD